MFFSLMTGSCWCCEQEPLVEDRMSARDALKILRGETSPAAVSRYLLRTPFGILLCCKDCDGFLLALSI